MTITKARFNEIHATAQAIIAEHGGIKAIDEMSLATFRPLNRLMVQQLIEREGIALNSARGHISRALRVMRHGGEADGRANNGGKRDGAGRPSLAETLARHKEYPVASAEEARRLRAKASTLLAGGNSHLTPRAQAGWNKKVNSLFREADYLDQP